MSKKIVIISVSILLILSLVSYLRFDLSNTPKNNRTLVDRSTNTMGHAEQFIEAKDIQEEGAVYNQSNDEGTQNIIYKDIEDDWCITVNELSEDDRNFVSSEMSSLQKRQGDISIGLKIDDSYKEGLGSYYLEPYREASKEELYFYVEQDNAYAMLTALQRNDIPRKKKLEVADRLLVLGYTGYATSTPVIYAMIDANRELINNNHQVNDQVTALIKKALGYALYGIERKNSTGLQSFVDLSLGGYIFSDEVSVMELIDDEVMSGARLYTEKLKESVNSIRVQEGLPELNTDFNRIAEYAFEFSVSALHHSYTPMMKHISQSLNEEYPELTLSGCTGQLYRRLETARR
jgi:hypothetical protein